MSKKENDENEKFLKTKMKKRFMKKKEDETYK